MKVTMLMKYVVVGLCVLVSSKGFSQENDTKRPTSLSMEFQQYPAGTIPQVMLEVGLSDLSVLNLRFGYNIVRHGDLGKHDDERGGGAGFSIGYRKYLKIEGNSFVYGIRSDLWFNSVDWTDYSPQASGNTKITVFQPTAMIGYQFVSTGHLTVTPTISLGAEINVSTEGEPVGEGAIGLVGIEVGYRF